VGWRQIGHDHRSSGSHRAAVRSAIIRHDGRLDGLSERVRDVCRGHSRSRRTVSITSILRCFLIVLVAGWGRGATPVVARQTIDLTTILTSVKAPADAAAALRSGDVVAFVVGGNPSNEVGIFAAVQVSTSVATFLSRFSELDAFQRRSAVRIAGAVSSPPDSTDFDALPIPASDVVALGSCRVGSCAVKLPTAAIEAREGADSAAMASVVKDVFLDLAERFVEGGLGALPAFGDKAVPTTPAQGMGTLLAGPTPLLSVLPGLREELAMTAPPAVVPQLFWLSESFGLRDVLELNAMTTHDTGRPDLPAVVLVERLYSSHYFVSGYSAVALVVDPAGGDPQAGAYLVYSARYQLDTNLDLLERHELEGHLHAYAADLITREKASLEGS
jgi:hypothetical protein